MQWIRWHYFWINLYQSHCILCHLFLTNLRIYFKCHLFLWIVTVIFYIPLIPNYKPPHKTKFYAPSTSLHRNMDPVRYILVTLLCLDLHSQEIRQHSRVPVISIRSSLPLNAQEIHHLAQQTVSVTLYR